MINDIICAGIGFVLAHATTRTTILNYALALWAKYKATPAAK